MKNKLLLMILLSVVLLIVFQPHVTVETLGRAGSASCLLDNPWINSVAFNRIYPTKSKRISLM